MMERIDAPDCLRCEEPGEQGTYKGMPVFECPGCENILLREVAR